MASLRHKSGTRNWFACYTDAAGVQRQRSTGTSVRTAAQRIADGYEQLYRRRQSEAQVRRVMADIFEEVHKEPLTNITLNQHFSAWLARIKAEVKPITHERYGEMATLTRKLAPDLVAMPLDRIEPKDILELRAKLIAARSASTANQTIKILRQSLKSAWIDGLIPENPAARVPRVRSERAAAGAAKRPFAIDELRALMAIADDEWRGMILAGLYTAGQRLSDIATMTASQIDLTSATVRFSTRKTDRDVILPIAAPWLADASRRVKGREPDARLFPRAYAMFVGAGNKVGRVSNAFRSLLAKAGMATPPGRTAASTPGRRTVQPLSFHSLRHTATSMLKNSGVSDSVAMDLVGHESVAVSRNYTHIDDATKRAALDKLPAISADKKARSGSAAGRGTKKKSGETKTNQAKASE